MTWFCQGWSQKLAEDSAGIWGLVNALVGDHFGYSDPSCFRVARFLFGFSWFSGGKMCCQLCRQPKARLFGMVLWVWKPGIWQWPLLGLRFIDDGVTFTPRYRWWQCHLWGLHKPCDHEDLKKRSCLESMLSGWLAAGVVVGFRVIKSVCQDPCPWTGPRSQQGRNRQPVVTIFSTSGFTSKQLWSSNASSLGSWWCGLMPNLAVYMKLMKPLWICPAWVIKVFKNLLLGVHVSVQRSTGKHKQHGKSLLKWKPPELFILSAWAVFMSGVKVRKWQPQQLI